MSHTTETGVGPCRALGRDRLLWADVAKGACIALVVLHHAVKLFVVDIAPAGLEGVATGWIELTRALKPVRMPLLFVVSGFFAAGAIGRPWAAARRRIVNGAWLYAVWLTVFVGVYAVDDVVPANRTQSLGDFAGELFWPETSMWFLYAMVAYFVLAKALAGLQAAWVVGGAAAVAASGSWLPIEDANRVAVLFHFVFFAAGAYYPEVVRRIGGLRRGVTAWTSALAVAFVVLTVATQLTGVPRSIQLLFLSGVGVPLGIAFSVRVARHPVVGRVLAWLGRRTLRVYVLHMTVLSGIGHLSPAFGRGENGASVVLNLVAPLLLAVPVVLVCLVAHDLLVRTGLGNLFEAPQRLTGGPREAQGPSQRRAGRDTPPQGRARVIGSIRPRAPGSRSGRGSRGSG